MGRPTIAELEAILDGGGEVEILPDGNACAKEHFVTIKVGDMQVTLNGSCHGKATLKGKELPAFSELTIRLKAGDVSRVVFEYSGHPGWTQTQGP